MILYHTSTVEIQRPELSYSRPCLDVLDKYLHFQSSEIL